MGTGAGRGGAVCSLREGPHEGERRAYVGSSIGGVWRGGVDYNAICVPSHLVFVLDFAGKNEEVRKTALSRSWEFLPRPARDR